MTSRSNSTSRSATSCSTSPSGSCRRWPTIADNGIFASSPTAYEERLFNVGRLDSDTSGLLLLTNDGDLAQVLAHPSFGVEKTYIATVRGVVYPNVLEKLRDGFELEDGEIHADKARLIGEPSNGRDGQSRSIVELTLHSGRNRIVRRMMDEVGHPVLEAGASAVRSAAPRNPGVGQDAETSVSWNSGSC